MKPDAQDWPFNDPPNVAVFTSKRILDGDEWIYYVTHDQDDGAWQFHPKSGPTPENEARVVSLRTVLDMDPTIGMLADLPLGWCAWREGRNSDWRRSKKI
jgi:hypothetical protein